VSKPTKDDLLEFMKKHGPENVDSITDKDSAIKHFRTSSKVYKQQRDEYKNERDTLIKDIEKLRKALIKTQNLVDELMKYQVNYINLTNHIRQKAEANPSVSRYIDLVNFVDRLEGE
jgi:septal ring factor EnvC (AmiA/AmiB activator)